MTCVVAGYIPFVTLAGNYGFSCPDLSAKTVRQALYNVQNALFNERPLRVIDADGHEAVIVFTRSQILCVGVAT